MRLGCTEGLAGGRGWGSQRNQYFVRAHLTKQRQLTFLVLRHIWYSGTRRGSGCEGPITPPLSLLPSLPPSLWGPGGGADGGLLVVVVVAAAGGGDGGKDGGRSLQTTLPFECKASAAANPPRRPPPAPPPSSLPPSLPPPVAPAAASSIILLDFTAIFGRTG